MTDDADLRPETLAAERVHETPDFVVRRERLRHADGREADTHYVAEPPAVTVLPFTPDGAVVTIREWRASVDRVTRSIPGGSIEPDDRSPAAAARRELREEAGHVADRLDRLAVREPAPGLTDSERHYFVAEGCVPAGDASDDDLDPDEAIRVTSDDYDDLLAAAVAGEVRSERLAAALFQHALRDAPR